MLPRPLSPCARFCLASTSAFFCVFFVSLMCQFMEASTASAADKSWLPVPMPEINPGGDAYPSLPTAIGDELYFVADNGQSPQLYRAAGFTATHVSDVYATTSGLGCRLTTSFPPRPVRQGTLILFGVDADHQCIATEVWSTTGSAASSQLVKRFDGIFAWYNLGDRTVIFAYEGGQGGLWQTDGTAAGTTLLKGGFDFDGDIMPQSMGDAIYFGGRRADTGEKYQLWRATLSSVVALDVNMANAITIHAYDNALYLSLSEGMMRLAAGSDTAVAFKPGVLSTIVNMRTAGDRLYLMKITYAPERAETWWRYDSASDTLEHIDGSWGRVTGLTQLGDNVYFSGYAVGDPRGDGSELLRLPLTSTTPIPVSPTFTTTGTQDIGTIITDGSLLYLLVNPRMIDSRPPTELWVSDGTADGTHKVVDLATSFDNANYDDCPCITMAGDRLYFDRHTPEHGVELWTVERLAAASSFVYLPNVTR